MRSLEESFKNLDKCNADIFKHIQSCFREMAIEIEKQNRRIKVLENEQAR